MNDATDPPPTLPESEWGQLDKLVLETHEKLAGWIADNADSDEIARRSAMHRALDLGSRLLAALGALPAIAARGDNEAAIAEQHERIYDLCELASKLMAEHPPKETP